MACWGQGLALVWARLLGLMGKALFPPLLLGVSSKLVDLEWSQLQIPGYWAPGNPEGEQLVELLPQFLEVSYI